MFIVVVVIVVIGLWWLRRWWMRRPQTRVSDVPTKPPAMPVHLSSAALREFDAVVAQKPSVATVRELYRLRGLALGHMREMHRRLPNDVRAELALDQSIDATARDTFERIERVKASIGTNLTVGPIDDMHYGHWYRAINDVTGH